jgi:hypothetical protein
MTISLPMASDTLRHEAQVIRDAAARAATQMRMCHDAVREAHEKIRSVQGGLEMLLAAIHADDPKRELLVRVGDLMRTAADSSSPPTSEEKP